MSHDIVAVVTTNAKKILYSGVPVFFLETKEEMERTALLISKVTMGMIHDLENGCLIIVRH
ncbi:MAG: capping complex subunit for YIEGIA [Eubacteriales bacterium]